MLLRFPSLSFSSMIRDLMMMEMMEMSLSLLPCSPSTRQTVQVPTSLTLPHLTHYLYTHAFPTLSKLVSSSITHHHTATHPHHRHHGTAFYGDLSHPSASNVPTPVFTSTRTSAVSGERGVMYLRPRSPPLPLRHPSDPLPCHQPPQERKKNIS